MKFGSAKKIVVEEFSAEDRELIRRLATVLNPFMDTTSKILSGNTTTADNLKSKSWRLDLPASVSTYTVAWGLNERPTEIRIANLRLYDNNAAPAAAYCVSWAMNNDGGIDLTFLGLDNTKRHIAYLIGQV